MTPDNVASPTLAPSPGGAAFSRVEKLCSKCGDALPLSRFHRNRAARGGYSNWCKYCQNAAKREKRKRDATSVYFLILPDESVYVGITRQEPRERWRKHLTAARAGKPGLLQDRLRWFNLPVEDLCDTVIVFEGDDREARDLERDCVHYLVSEGIPCLNVAMSGGPVSQYRLRWATGITS